MKHSLFKFDYGPAFQSACLERRTLAIPRSLDALDGRSILFLTDLHLSHMFPESAARRLFDQILPLRPDILCFGGDLAETDAEQERAALLLSKVRPPIGAFAVFGNNDCELLQSKGCDFSKRLKDAGVVPLIDSETCVDLPGGARLRVAGFNSLSEHTAPASPFFADSGERDFRLLLAHYPKSIRTYDSFCAAMPHLGLAGHTHGGQFRLFGLTPYSIGFEAKKTSRLMPVSGWTDRLGFPVLVSPGIGTSRLPFRLNVPPAIHMITLSCGAEESR